MTKVLPTSTTIVKTNDEEEDKLIDETSSSSSTTEKQSFFSSIKFLLMLMISLLIIISVVTLSIIWISGFSYEVSNLSSNLREEEFSKIISFIERTLREVLLVVESVKSQLHTNFDFQNPILIEKQMFKIFKVTMNYLESVTLAVYVGDSYNSIYGYINDGGSALYLNITPGQNQLIWECNDFANSEYCVRNDEPDIIAPPYETTFVMDSAAINPGHPVFTLSYSDPSTPQYVFLTTVSSLTVGNADPTKNFTNYFAFDMTVTTVSKFLLEITKSVSGSVAFVIEKKTDFIIASDDPEASVATFDENGVIMRKTALDFGGYISKIGSQVYNIFKSFDEITCNTKKEITMSDKFILVHRLCTDEGIDWILVFSVPQWNYIGSMVIAILCALVGSLLIVLFSVLMAIMFSLKIVKPFHNLIEAFEMVSNMELDNLYLTKTRFSEVRSLQNHFTNMIGRIKLYRRFIPTHLLSQLDGNQQEEEEVQTKGDQSSIVSHSKPSESFESRSHRGSHISHQSQRFSSSHHTTQKSRHANLSMFSLYLDRRKVTFVSVYMEGLNHWLLNLNPNDCVNILSDVFEIIGQVARTSSGQIGKFENENLSIHFNATTDQPKHELKGLQICHQLLDKLNLLKEKKMKNNQFLKKDESLLSCFKFRIIALCQNNLCGNLGTKQVMNFSIIGSSQHNLECMIDSCKNLDLPIVISDELHSKIDGHFQSRYVDTKEMIVDDYYSSPMLTVQSSTKAQPRRIYELGESTSIEQDGKFQIFFSSYMKFAFTEWMYELQAKEKKNRWQKYNQACELYFSSEYKYASQLFSEYITDLSNNKEDRPAMQLLNNCEQKISTIE